jgi:hypothetical protein
MSSESGQSASAFVAVVALAVFLVAGIVVDGGGRLATTARAEAVAGTAVRLASDATAASGIEQGRDEAIALRAAQDYLAGQPDVTGDVQVSGATVTVTVHATRETVFLSLIGIRVLASSGSASGRLRG